MRSLRIVFCEDRTEEQEKILTILWQCEIPTETAIFVNGEDFDMASINYTNNKEDIRQRNFVI